MDVCVGSKAPGAIAETRNSPGHYRVTLDISVEDVTALWAAAAEICLRDGGLTPDEVDETIGPREDPSIPDCLTMIALPARLAGSRIVDFTLDEMDAPRSISDAGVLNHETAHSPCCPVRAASFRHAVVSN